MSTQSLTRVLRFQRLKIAYSWKCNARCAHCSVSSGPDRSEKLNPDVVLQCIDDAAALGLKWVEFTGGEIFIFSHDLRLFMERTHAHNLKVGVDTNGFWADDEQKACSTLAELKAQGLARINLSADQYHAAYIDLSRVYNVIIAARELNIDCQVTVCALRNDLNALEFVSNLHHYTPKIQIQPIAPFGRAQRMDSRMMIKYSFELAGTPCDAVTGPMVAPDGRVTLCCAPPAQFPEHIAKFSPLVLGRLVEDRLKEILLRAQDDPLLNLFAAEGMCGLIRRLNSAMLNSYEPRPEGYFGTCDLCTEIFSSEQTVRKLRDLTEQMLHVQNQDLGRRDEGS